MDVEKKLKDIELKLRETALTMRSCNMIGEFEFHAKRIEKQMDKLGEVRQFISGAGTGKD